MGSIYFTLVSLVVVFAYGMSKTGSIATSASFMMMVLILGALEVSLSFDNAVVNAKVLGTMEEKWRKRFITYGMIIAIFGMRLVFPIAIISIAGHMNPFEAVSLALNDQEKYAEILKSSNIAIAGFGTSFLFLVAFSFFFDVEKDVHWVNFIESKLSKLGAIKSSGIILTAILAILISLIVPTTEQYTFMVASAIGIIIHEIVKGIGDLLEDDEEESSNMGQTATMMVAKTGFATFLYLEMLDASFSLDGVIGALVVSKDIIIIALGLGIGAMAVRSLTLMFVDKGTLAEFKYLEHGAFWAILSLSIIMTVSIKFEIPEIITAALAASLIVASYIGSVISNKSESIIAELDME
jgi:hypothetical protein